MEKRSRRRGGGFLAAGGLLIASFLCLSLLWNTNEKRADVVEVPAAKQTSLPVAVLLTPHHMVAREFMHKVFREVSNKVGRDEIHRIILVSPNHFNIGKNWLIGSDRNWQTPLGSLQSDKALAQRLKGAAFIREDILEREHGVRNIFPFIKEYFPQATVLPLAVRDGSPDESIDDLAQRIHELSDAHTLLVISADFSHYLDRNFSRFHDERALDVLRRGDIDRSNSLDVDCPACVRLALRYATLQDKPSFQFVSRSSSLELSGVDRVGDETSHITGYFSSDVSEIPEVSAHILFSGQVAPADMTENARRIFMSQDGNVFEQNDKLLWNVFDSRTHALMSFPQSNQPLLRDDENTSIRTFGERRIAFIRVDGDRYARDGFGEVLRTLDEVKQQSDVRVVLWKGLSVHSSERQRYMRALVDAGADLVIGFDTAQIEPMEIYKEKVIFPSLGNISSGCLLSRSSCEGVVMGMGVNSDQIQYVLMPIVSGENGKVSLATDQVREKIFKELSVGVSDVSLRSAVQQGFIQIGGDLLR